MDLLSGDKYQVFFVVAIALLCLVFILAYFVRKSSKQEVIARHTAELAEQNTSYAQFQAEILGRLSNLTESSAISQSELTKTLNARLDAISKQVTNTLYNNSARTSESLGALKKHLDKIDEAQKNIAELSTDIVGLQEILSNKQARGAFGEIQLNDIVCNILPPSAFSLQITLSNGTRPDCLLKLPNPPGSIAVDAKFPLESYQAYRNADNDIERRDARRKFRLDVRHHVKDIKKRYIVDGETAESALMFVPSESVYAEIHSTLSDVVEESYRLRVWIVSPTTLWALLNTVRAVLKDVHMRDQANVIQKEVHLLMEDVERLNDRAGKLQQHFDQATNDLRGIKTSTEKIWRRGQRMDDFQLEDSENNTSVAEISFESDKKKVMEEIPQLKLEKNK